MREVEELLKSVVTVDEGLTIISNLERNQTIGSKSGKKLSAGFSREVLDDFKTAFYKMQVVSLTLAINPSKDFLKGLQKWFSDNLGNQVVFYLKVDPQIIGGARIICRDHFRDFSLAEVIEKTTKNQDEFVQTKPEMLQTAII